MSTANETYSEEYERTLLNGLIGADGCGLLNRLQKCIDFYDGAGMVEKEAQYRVRLINETERVYGTDSRHANAARIDNCESLRRTGRLQSAHDTLIELKRTIDPISDSRTYGLWCESFAKVNRDMRRFDTALEHIRIAIPYIIKHHGERSIEISRTYYVAAAIHVDMEEYDIGISYAMQAHDIALECRDPTSEFVSLNLIATARLRTKHYDIALRVYDDVLRKQRAVYGKKSSRCTLTINNISACYAGMDRIADAYRYGKLALANIEADPKNHTNHVLSIVYGNMAQYLIRGVGPDRDRMADLTWARRCIERAIENCGNEYPHKVQECRDTLLKIDEEMIQICEQIREQDRD